MKDNNQTQKSEALILPEYGYNVQHLVDYCKTIEDREERTRCAHAIVRIMGMLHPHLKQASDNSQTLWDHLAIMARFELDIDYPTSVIQKEQLQSKPTHFSYSDNDIIYRHYGQDRKSTRLNSSHANISYAVFCLKKKT